MKPIPSVFLVVLACTALTFSQDEKNAVAGEAAATGARTFISDSLEVPAFTPPAPPVEKRVPAMRVDAAVILPSANSRTLTLIRGEASTLPDIPIPPPPEPREPHAPTPEELAREAYSRRHTLQIGATVFDHRLSVVHWQHPDTRESYEAVCGFDIGLLAGVGQFVSDGETYSVMLMHSSYDTAHFRRFTARMFPNLPEVPAESIAFLKGNPKDLIGTAPITLLKDLIATEKSRLTTYQEDRTRYQEAFAAWEKAHPVAPRDETFWLRPHRGSRYLTNPSPEKGINR